MTNQIETELRAIQNTITETKKLKNQRNISPEYHKYLSKKIEQLHYEEKRILKEIGIKGDLL